RGEGQVGGGPGRGGDAVHPPGAGGRRAASLPLRRRWAAIRRGSADLHDPRRARLDVSDLGGAPRARRPAGGRRTARLSGDRGPLPHLPARRESEDPRLADERRRAYGLRITRVPAVPAVLPCHSANANALLTSASGKLCETTFESGYLSRVRTRSSSAAGMIQGL